MPVIFVHGVNNRREDPDYEVRRAVTETFLRAHLGGATINGRRLPVDVASRFPYWGDLGTRFAWNMASLPAGAIDSLGTGGVETDLRPLVALLKDALPDAGSAADEPLTALAKRRSLEAAVDALADVLALNPLNQPPAEVAAFIVGAQSYAAAFAGGAPPWLATVTTDMQFVQRLAQEVSVPAAPAVNALGGAGTIVNAVAAAAARLKQAAAAAKTKVLDSAGDFASTKALAWARAPLNGTLGRFFGDVFIYLHGRGRRDDPGPIPARLLEEWDAAIAAAPLEPVVIIGHSLGGVISFDLLSHFRPDLQVDLFVSVGSQVSHFEEMKLFLASDPSIPSGDMARRVAKPANVRHWINVFDEVDVFSYACAKVFDGVHDFQYDTATYVTKAHGAYFTQARFYQRLRARIDGL